jgi:ferredoxin--NADP+ reductase
VGSPRIAIIGAGPSGFYAADQLLKQGAEIDLVDALPTPFGLVRTGVAPDHPKIKSVTRIYERTATHEAFRFFGGVRLGADVSRQELLDRYDGVIYALGASADRRLEIAGEDLAGSHAATEFVAWYNGHPDFADRTFDLSRRRAVVVGNGNVALDVARMLALDPDELAGTDTADHALAALSGSRVEEIVVLGRRGAAQAAFTNPELLELGEMSRADVVVAAEDLELDPLSALVEDDAGARRRLEILRDYAARERTGRSHRIVLRFLCSPVAILGDAAGRVSGIRVARNRLEIERGRVRAVATGVEEDIECGLVLRAVGYRGEPLADLPFDATRGVIANRDGRVVSDDGVPLPREYVVGWIKRGPTGVIGTNKKDAAETVACVLADLNAGILRGPRPTHRDTASQWLRERVPHLVEWAGWQAIDVHERLAGEASGRPRVKLVRVGDMHEVSSARAVDAQAR